MQSKFKLLEIANKGKAELFGNSLEINELRIVVEKVSKNIPKKIRIEKIKS